MNRKSLQAFVSIDVVLDAAPDAPRIYADTLTALVADGYAELLPMGVKGKPTGERAEVLTELHEAYKAQGVTAIAGRRNRITRLTYALAILAANPRREEESDEAYIKRCATIRKIANDGDVPTIEKALRGPVERKGRGTKGPKDGRTRGRKGAASGDSTPEEVTPEEAKPADTGARLVAAHNALMAAMKEFQEAHEEHVKTGGKITKAAATQVTTRAAHLIKALTA